MNIKSIFAGKINLMIRYFENFSLKAYNTFGIEAFARHFFEFTEADDLQGLVSSRLFQSDMPRFILGGGSNLLLAGDFNGWVIFPNIPGIAIEGEDRSFVRVRAGAGVVWDDLVEYTVREGWGGAENLSLIPGRVGAVPVQNIGAYGQEASEIIEEVSGVDIRSGEVYHLTSTECRFGYRDSIFKNEMKDFFVITSVRFRFDKFPLLRSDYPGVREALQEVKDPGVADLRRIICDIRRSKLPDPEITGNAGSFFKNPVVTSDTAAKLQAALPALPVYDTADPQFKKLSAGWLIDHCGWKGFRRGDAGVHVNHALVLVNYGKATGREIYDLSEEIRTSVREKTGVELEREVNVAGL
jgi:UDP-N-acetylmuramate dehydrogenase